MDVVQVRERSRSITMINNLYGQANALFVDSTQCEDLNRANMLWSQGQALANAAEELQVDYYNRYPNCMTRRVYAWAQ
ncbi:hypothetical protein D3C81_190610 [compost metagenome]